MTLLFRPESSATFSPCQKYRYTLVRRWHPEPPMLNFLMLNPSTADAFQDDPTVTRCLDYAKRWGYSALTVTNIFAYRATDPKELYELKDPIGPNNDDWILKIAAQARQVVCAWGRNGEYLDRGPKVVAMLRRRKIEPLRMAKSGYDYPMHPLYLSRRLEPVPLHD